MRTTKQTPAKHCPAIVSALVATAACALLAGCGAAAGDSAALGSIAEPTALQPVTIEESDIFRREGDRLYLHNRYSGLNVIDLADPARLALLGRTAAVAGEAAELYVHRDHAVVLLDASTADECEWPEALEGWWQSISEVALIDVRQPRSPAIVARRCIPGKPVSSRMIGDFLYIVTAMQQSGGGSWTLSFDLSRPSEPTLAAQLHVPWASTEIHVTTEAIFVAGLDDGSSPTTSAEPEGGVQCGWWFGNECPSDAASPPPPQQASNSTRIKYVELSATDGRLQPRGEIVVAGEPQGRFHMDARRGQFRIVTFDSWQSSSSLHVIDTSRPDELRVLGRLDRIGQGERLYATRFDRDRAYVVTFRQTDPLWIVDLEDPSFPRIVGELQVPGWSDFIFPRGDQLLCVGRGDQGAGLGVSLFDVSDPTEPRAISQIQIGDWNTTSEANLDHRAVTIIEAEGDRPTLLVLGHTTSIWNDDESDCVSKNLVQLVDVNPDGLRARGAVEQRGAIRRTLQGPGSLLSISDYELLSLSTTDRDHPRAVHSLVVGSDEALVTDNSGCFFGGEFDDTIELFKCHLGDGPISGRPWPVATLLLLGLLLSMQRVGARRRK